MPPSARQKNDRPLAMTMGEPGGVGPELTVKAWRALKEAGPVFFVLGAPALLEQYGATPAPITRPEEAAGLFADALPVMPLLRPVNAAPGAASPDNAAAVIESIERATRAAMEGEAAGVVTNPIQKSVLLAAGFRFPGHTEFLGALTKDAPLPPHRRRGPVMMIAGPQLRTAPVTIHQSVKEAVAALTPRLIFHTACVVAEALRGDFGIAAPRLAISGLNPHAGEEGALGAEETLIIGPAVEDLRRAGLDARGPLAADALFHEMARQTYDAAVCMLHDQALIPAKTLDFYNAVNVTLGLPIVRASPDHGAALDIAGKDIARPDSLIAAVNLAGRMAAQRACVP